MNLQRMRQTRSLALRNRDALRWILAASHRGGRFAPNITPHGFELSETGASRGEQDAFPAAQTEFDDGQRFFEHFFGRVSPGDLRGRRILDIGCGYGGRTVYYAEVCGAEHVHGIEISRGMVDRCRGFAVSHRCDRVTFDYGRAEQLPYQANSFDALIIMDVLEHVEDPLAAIREIARVLEPGGRAYAIFPPYRGLGAAHLEYVTSVPGLHRLFDPEIIVETVNEFLEATPERFGSSTQPPPRVNSDGRHTLPGLNGLGVQEALAAATDAGLTVEQKVVWPLLHNSKIFPGAEPAARMIGRYYERWDKPELLIASLGLVLGKPA